MITETSRVCCRKCSHWAQPFHIYLNSKLFKAPIGQKWCHLCRLGLWKRMDGEPRELQNPAQSAMGEERGDHERTPWLAKMCWDKHFLFYSILENIKCFRVIFQILWTLLCPLLKGPTPSAWYQTKDQQKLNNLNSILFNKMLTSGKKVKKKMNNFYTPYSTPYPHS